MPCALAGKHQSDCAHDGHEVAPGFFKLFVYNNIIELGDVTDFLAGGAQSPLDCFFGVLSPPPQPALEGADMMKRLPVIAVFTNKGTSPSTSLKLEPLQSVCNGSLTRYSGFARAFARSGA